MAQKRSSASTVLASYSEMAKALPRLEAAIDDRPRLGLEKLKAVERGRMLASVHAALAELQKTAMPAGVLQAPRSQLASLLQSAFAEHAARAEQLKEFKRLGTREAKFDTKDPGWLTVGWEMLKTAVKGKIGFQDPGAPLDIPSKARIAIFGDWATGQYGAPWIASSIENDRTPPQVIVHLGDTYYSGTDQEFASRFVPFWPKVSGAIHRSLNGNHEMYSGGQAFLATIRKELQQPSTVFALQSDHWLLIGLDTALVDHSLGADQLKWFDRTLKKAGDRKVILFSHHQPFSRFEDQGLKLTKALKPWWSQGKIFAWYWGHEHRCILYAKHSKLQLWGRCVGHGGMPDARGKPLGACPAGPKWRKFKQFGSVPPCELLDGPNPFLAPYQKDFLPHGYAILTLDDARLVEEYLDPRGTVVRAARELN